MRTSRIKKRGAVLKPDISQMTCAPFHSVVNISPHEIGSIIPKITNTIKKGINDPTARKNTKITIRILASVQ